MMYCKTSSRKSITTKRLTSRHFYRLSVKFLLLEFLILWWDLFRIFDVCFETAKLYIAKSCCCSLEITNGEIVTS